MFEAALTCLALNIYHEARGEPLEGQYAVAMVTLNRAKRKLNRICAEVYRPYQFSWTLNNDVSVTDHRAFQRAKQVAKRALTLQDFTGGADHFHAHYVSPQWAQDLDYIGQWGNHYFYRNPR